MQLQAVLCRGTSRRRRGPGALAEAKGWRADASSAVRKGTMRSPPRRRSARPQTPSSRAIRTRNGQPYRASVIRAYEHPLRLRVIPDLGARRLGDVTRFDLQDLVDRLLAEGLAPSTIQNTLMPLRAIYGER